METEAHTSWASFPKTTLLVNDSLEAKLGSDSYAEDLVTGLHHHFCKHTGRLTAFHGVIWGEIRGTGNQALNIPPQEWSLDFINRVWSVLGNNCPYLGRFILGYCLKVFVKSGHLPSPCLCLPKELCLPVPELETTNDWSHWFPN